MKNKTGLLLLGVFTLPLIVGVAYFQYALKFGSSNTVNYGELISPMQVVANLPESMQNRWIYVVISDDSSQCDEQCRQLIRLAGTVRLLTNNEIDRVEVLFLSEYNLRDPDLPTNFKAKVNQFSGQYHSIKKDISSIIQNTHLSESVLPSTIYLIDPLGNLMMQYPEGKQEIQKMVSDIERLLKYSQIG